jgi:hypothetical protein
MPNGKGFGEWLSRQMALQGVSGKQIAKTLGKDQGTISSWKTGKAAPTNADDCLRLGTILKVESPLRLLINAGIISREVAKEMGLKPLPIPDYNPERERVIKKIKNAFPREDWDAMINAWESNRKEGVR